MALFGGMFEKLVKQLNTLFNKGYVVPHSREMAINAAQWDAKIAEVERQVQELRSYAKRADESYQILIHSNLESVPAVDLYDGDYVSRLEEILQKAYATQGDLKTLEATSSQVTQVATEIQTYLKEETSSYEAAKLWDSKFVKGVQEHIPPHLPKNQQGIEGSGASVDLSDSTMSEVMSAYRNWSSFAQAAIDLYGSQRLINATYEAVEEGQDPMTYIQEILDLNQRDSSFGGGLHEDVIVPYTGFFGSGFFF